MVLGPSKGVISGEIDKAAFEALLAEAAAAAAEDESETEPEEAPRGCRSAGRGRRGTQRHAAEQAATTQRSSTEPEAEAAAEPEPEPAPEPEQAPAT